MLHAALVGWFLLVAAGMPHRISADETALRIVDVSVGFDGLIKVGRLTPVRIEVAGPVGERVEASITAPDPDGSQTTWPLSDVVLDAEGTGGSDGLFRVGQMGGVLRVNVGDIAVSKLFEPAQGATGEDDSAVRLSRQSVRYVGVCSNSPVAADALRSVAEAVDPQQAEALVVLEFESDDAIPLIDEGMDALDVLVVSADYEFDEPHSKAVSRWVRSGGHLVFGAMVSPDGELYDNALSEWIPLEFVEKTRFDDLASLVDRVRGRPELRSRRDGTGARLRLNAGRALVSSLDGTVVARVAHGLGRVTVCAVDWSAPPFTDWEGLPGLMLLLSDLPAPQSDGDDESSAVPLASGGVSEMASQLTAQLDQFPGVLRGRYLMVLLMIASLVAIVGPIDYLLVQRLFKRPQLTWFTLPLWVIAATLVGDACANRWNGDRAMANQFDLIDIDAGSGTTRIESRITFYSDTARRYELNADVLPWLSDDGERQRAQVSWNGAPESGFRGMYRTGGLDLGNPPYSLQEERTSIANLPFDEHSTRSLSAAWIDYERGDLSSLIESRLVDSGAGRLNGTITHHLPGEITEWCLAYESSAYVYRPSQSAAAAGGIPPGTPWDPEQAVQPRRLSLYLTGLTHVLTSRDGSVGDDAVPGVSQYDPQAADARQFAQTLTFFEAAGGRSYTNLSNSSLERHDLSRLLTLNRAVLFGRLETPATEYQRDKQPITPDRRSTYIRLILPVAPAQNLRSRDR